MKTWHSFEHNGISYLTRNRILSIVDDVVTFEIESKGQFYECLIDLIDIEVLKNRVGFGNGYAYIAFPGTCHESLHNVIAKRMGLEPKPGRGSQATIDHENNIKLDNRRCNLRIADRTLQGLNKQKYKSYKGKQTTSQFFGLTGKDNCWRCQLYYPTGVISKYFKTELEAAQWVTQKMKEIDPERFAKKISYNEQLLSAYE